MEKKSREIEEKEEDDDVTSCGTLYISKLLQLEGNPCVSKVVVLKEAIVRKCYLLKNKNVYVFEIKFLDS